MRISLVLDASAAVKWFVREEESDEMRKIRDLYLRNKLGIYVPSLLLLELTNALRYVKGLTAADVVNAVNALRALQINIVDDAELLDDAVSMAFESNITVYDAIYLALAKSTNSKLITYDTELLTKFKDIAKKASQLMKQLLNK